MRRVIALLLALLVAPLAADGQPTRPAYRIGYLETGEIRPRAWEAFKQRLRELGYVEGRTVTFEIRSANDRGSTSASCSGCSSAAWTCW